MSSSINSNPITVGARNSPLSKCQTLEVLTELQKFYPEVRFECFYLLTTGDKDQKTSLRTMSKNDFFTKEIDQLQIAKKFRISIHSAKDLPENLAIGLKIIAITKGLDNSDSLVMRNGESLSSMPPKSIIATSSDRREQAIRQIRQDFRFVDIRGTIGQRLEKLENGEVDAVVIAEAALIRLKLTHLNRYILPGPTVPYQGQLAVLSLDSDPEMEELFSCLDVRKIT